MREFPRYHTVIKDFRPIIGLPFSSIVAVLFAFAEASDTAATTHFVSSSTQAVVGTGDAVSHGEFVISGTASKQVTISRWPITLVCKKLLSTQ